MSDVKHWLTNETARVAELPCLEDALFDFRGGRYARYRLRYVFVQACLRTLFRFTELALFASALPFEVLGPVLMLRSFMLVGEGLWWGALETLRGEVRTFLKQGRLGQASQRVRQWLALALVLGFVVLGFGASWVWLGPSAFSSFSVVDVFLLSCCVRWGTDVVVSAYHAGVYGVRRVYRPLWSLALVDFADIGLLLAAFLWLGVWGLGPSMVLVGAVRALVAWSFTRRVYRALKLDVGAPGSWFRVLGSKAVWAPRHSLEHAASNVVAQVDALFVLGLLSAPGETESTLLLAALFHVLAPLQAAASAWSRLFYFDFKRLEAWGSPFLLRRFEAFSSRTSWWVPLPIGVVTLGLMALFWRGPYVLLALELTALALVRSRLSLVHIRAYSLSDHGFLLRLFFGMLGVAAVTPFLAHLPPEGALASVVGLMAAGLLVLGHSQKPLAPQPAHGLLEPSIWLSQLLDVKESVYLGLARVDRRLSTVRRLGRAVRETVDDSVQARLSNDTLLWFSRCPVVANALLMSAAGTVCELRLGNVAAGGWDALERGLEGDSWRRYMGTSLSAEHVAATLPGAAARTEVNARDWRALERTLGALHPEARVVQLANTMPFAQLSAASSRELRRLLLDAARGISRFRSLGQFEVAVLAPAGEPTALVIVPKSTRPSHSWKGQVTALVQRTNIAWTLHDSRKGARTIVG